jgi:hypothetical protein
MPRMIIEVCADKSKALQRANYYTTERKCDVQPISSFKDVTWITDTPRPDAQTASDVLDGEVWVVLAIKNP